MKKTDVEQIVDSAFDKALNAIMPLVNRELHPGAFANEYSWLRVKSVFDLQNAAIRDAVKESLSNILGE